MLPPEQSLTMDSVHTNEAELIPVGPVTYVRLISFPTAAFRVCVCGAKSSDEAKMNTLSVERLTREAFAPFGDVIELDGARHFPINGGTAERYHDLATVDVTEALGRPLISVFRAQPCNLPLELTSMERHPLGSQAFIPLSDVKHLVIVAPAGEFDPARLRVFAAKGFQGVNYARGVWHHPLIVLERAGDFIVVDRGGSQPNCDEVSLPEPYRVELDTLFAD